MLGAARQPWGTNLAAAADRRPPGGNRITSWITPRPWRRRCAPWLRSCRRRRRSCPGRRRQDRTLIGRVEKRPADAPNEQRQHDAEQRRVQVQRRQEKLRHGNDRAADGAEQARTEAVRERAGDGRHDHDDHRIGDDDPADLGRRVAQEILQIKGQKKIDRRKVPASRNRLKMPALKSRARNIEGSRSGVLASASVRSKKSKATRRERQG